MKSYPKFLALDAIKKEGLKLMFLLRLSPIIPFNVLNYFMGVTGISVKDFLFGGLGMIPGTIVYVYIGTTLGNISDIASGGSSNLAT